jgi:penicillin-binding protein 1A
MAPSLPSALGASEASLLEMVSAYSVFPNKGIRMQPHLIRKVLSRDGSLLEEWDNKSFKVTSEYVALTMVEMMRGVTSGGGTAAGANAAGHPLAGKTGTVNDHTDVWFIGYTPTYVTGVWMGNPEKKISLGKGMTGGGGALPFFNAFMSQFMKDKKRETFPEPPPMPPDIKREAERRKREELEKLEKENSLLGTSNLRNLGKTGNVSLPDSTISNDSTTPTEAPESNGSDPKPVNTPRNTIEVVRPPTQPTPLKKPETQPEPKKDEGSKRKGKKGDG